MTDSLINRELTRESADVLVRAFDGDAADTLLESLVDLEYAGETSPASETCRDRILTCSGYDNAVRSQDGERLHHLFEQRCDAEPESRDALAVDGPAGSLSYGELDARVNQLARFLHRSRDVRPGDRVALLFDHAVDSYVGMLAVMKLHAAYVPLDPGFPPDRLAYIVADAEVRTVLSHSSLSGCVAELDGDVRLLFLDELNKQIGAEREERLDPTDAGEPVDDLCYVIYTSGTTGQPKGVAVTHASICNFVRVAAEVYGVVSSDRVYQGLTIAFDFSIEEIWVAWMVGATLVPRPRGGNLIGAELHEFLTEHEVSALCCVPTLLATLEEEVPGLRFLLVSGESCPQQLADRWHSPGRRFLNVYGPTEATVTATWTVMRPNQPVTIGMPLPTYSIVVLDPERERALAHGELGELGELGIAGIGLAEGYLNLPERTARAFVRDFLEIPNNPSGRIYRTGDLGRVNEHGEIEHHGRIDTQVKIHGYRIELSEIESVLRQVPEVSQAIVDLYEPEPGVKELVAYYRPRSDCDAVDPARVYEWLREKLPRYMVPAYLEPLAEVPMLPSGKVDRGALPRPSGPRQLSTGDEYVPPSSELESALADQLAAVLGLERVSVDSHFFDVLGANSLLMARFNARLRSTAAALPRVSMKDVYLHPTVRSLAAALSESTATSAAAQAWTEPELPAPTGTPRYALCGVLQVLSFLVYVGLVGVVLDASASWVLGAHGALEIYLRGLVVGGGLLLGTGLFPIAAKWILIGRFKAQSIRVWSLAYFRFWFVKTLIVMNPLPHLLIDTPLYTLYLRALGVKIGNRVLIFSQHIPVCADLLTIGPDTVVCKDAFFNGYRARAGVIELGPVTVGPNVFIGERAVLDIHTTLEAGAQLGHSSSLHAGQVVPAGQCWHGSPAEPAPQDSDYRTVPPAPASRLRAARYAAGRLLLLLAIAGPLEAIVGALLLAHPRVIDNAPLLVLPTIAALALFGPLLISLLVSVGVPRLLTRLLKPGKTYPLYGFHFSVQRLIARTSNNPLLTGLLGDSAAIVHYLRALGYRFGVIEQTGTNFGLDIRQELPALSEIGTGTIVSDGLSMMNAEFSSTSFRVMPTVLGKRNYVGNSISFPAGARTGENCLFATKAMVPIGGPVRSDVGLLGSPCFEIPRSVLRDRRFDAISTGAERKRRVAAKTRHNAVTMVLHLLVYYLLILGFVAVAVAPLGGAGLVGWAGTVASSAIEVTFMLGLSVLAERAATGFRKLQPKYCSIYEIDFWRHERFWKVAPSHYLRILDGTPFKVLVWRLLGVPIGHRVFDDGLQITERTLVSIGDDATFNAGACLQSHTLEDGAFKSDYISVGKRCTVGTGALINYETVMEDGSLLAPDSFLMKGSRVEAGARWGGNPATELPAYGTALPVDLPTDAEAELQAA